MSKAWKNIIEVQKFTYIGYKTKSDVYRKKIINIQCKQQRTVVET